MTKTILGSFAAAALVSGAVMAAPCDPCDDVAACAPCGDVAACNPCDDICAKPKRSKLKVYADAAAMVGNVDHGFTGNVVDDDGEGRLGFTMAAGVKATIGVQRGKNAVELGYTGLYNNLSTSAAWVNGQNTHVLVNYNAVDVNFVKTLDRNPNLKVLVGIGYANFTERQERQGAVAVSTANDLAGLHVGGKWSRDFGRTNRVGIETYGKLGVYANTHTVAVGGGTLTVAYGNNCGAWVAAGGVNLTYKLTNRTKAFVGYDVTKIEGIARGHNRGIGSDDGAIIQGLVFGAKAAF
ncbi:MAG: hypothetical protein ACRC46_03490 [Thermoguttaceae bacterium]